MVGRGRQRLWIAGGLALIVAVFAGGWFAARAFQSPAQREAAARPPAPGPIFAPVTYGPLDTQLSGSGTVSYQSVDSVKLPSSATAGVVTAQHKLAGQTIRSGDVLTEINGRPLLVFVGRFDFYRDLQPGMSGPDVVQLQDGLEAAGSSIPRSEHGKFGASTAAALNQLYTRAGYSAPNGMVLGEVAVVIALPARVASVAAIGSHISPGDTAATLGRGAVLARINVDPSAFVQVHTGAAASITIDGMAAAVAGRVTGLIEQGSQGESTVLVTPTTALPSNTVGRAVVSIITTSVITGPALLVPTRAVAIDRSGVAHVLVEHGQGKTRESVEVQVIGHLGGQSAVRPTAADTLRRGDIVQVG